MKCIVKVIAVAVALLALSLSARAQLYSGALAGANEVNPGDLGGSGTAFLAVVGDRAVFEITVVNLSAAVVAAHIHRGNAGVNGPVVLDFSPTFTAGVAKGSVPISAALSEEIRQRPSGFYFNVHTTAFPGGAVRGQVVRELSNNFFASLSGANEVSNGDLGGSGRAEVMLSPSTGRVAYNITVFNLASNVVASHIHRGRAGTNGPVIIDFGPTFVNNQASGMVQSTAALAQEVSGNIGGFYVNVHTTTSPGGAVRGQLENGGGTQIGSPAPTPTLSEWALILLGMIVALVGARRAMQRT